MRVTLHLTVFTLFLFLIGAFVSVHEELHQAMMKMMQKMKSMNMSGDADRDFAMLMIEHHQGSIDMATIEAKSGKDEKLKSMAQQMLNKQPLDQKKLDPHAKGSHNQSQATDAVSYNSKFVSEMKSSMHEMESKMSNMKMSGDLDHDFATMMVDHHKAAVKMTDAELPYGKVTEVKDIAKKIKSDSQKEINELQNWLSSHN